MKPIPTHPRRILLVHPTRYLGNVLLAGGLMQAFVTYCEHNSIALRIVVDVTFKELLHDTLPADVMLYYPRQEIAKATSNWQKLKKYCKFLGSLRAFNAELAFNLEEDSVSHRLTQLSGAAFRLGCSVTRHRRGYHHVLPIDFSKRPESRQHRWYSFAEVFSAVGLPEQTPRYLQFPLAQSTDVVDAKLQSLGVQLPQGFVALHAGASKEYKYWPSINFAALSRLLVEAGHQVVFIGSGRDADNTSEILAQLPPEWQGDKVINCCNQFSLAELVQLFRRARFVVGNDSGPFHLASALGIPGAVIFGPTEIRLWGPLSACSVALKGNEQCSPECTRKQCIHQHRCLWAITPERVIETMQRLLSPSVAAPTTLHIS